MVERDVSPLDLPQSTLQNIYDQIENCFMLCTKRTTRKQPVEAWETDLDPGDSSNLQQSRERVRALESQLSPSSTPAAYRTWRAAKVELENLLAVLRRKAVDRVAEKERREARQHASTWKLLAAFKQKRIQPEVPPSVIYDHYKTISQVPDMPLSVEEPTRQFVGPLTREDSELENDITAADTRTALDSINARSAPGPDGLTPPIITGAFRLTLLVSFLARFLTRCFRAAWVPLQWRTSENFILYKGKGPVFDVSSFRAILLTQILAKVRMLLHVVMFLLASLCYNCDCKNLYFSFCLL